MEKKNKIKSKEFILLALLILLTIIIRLPNTTHPRGIDTFTVYKNADSISEIGYAIWVLHPTSLIGMYPLSTPSAEPFFLSIFSLITGLDMSYSILFTQIAISLLGILGMFIFIKEFSSFLFAFLSAFVFSISTYFIDFTRWFVTTRILLIVLIPLLLWVLLKTYKDKANRIKYSILAIIIYLLLAMTHRLVQLVSIILFAYVLTLLIFLFPRFKKTNFYRVYFEKRYKTSKTCILLDIIIALFILGALKFIKFRPLIAAFIILVFISMIWPEYRGYSKRYIKVKSPIRIFLEALLLIFGFVLTKIIDLLSRGRLLINTIRLLNGFYNTKLISMFSMHKLTALILTLFFLVLIFYLTKIKKLKNLFYNHIFTPIKKKPQFYLSCFVLTLFAILFASQFFGFSFYSPSMEEYTKSTLFKGSSTFIIFLNMIINYFTGTTLLLPFVVIGLVYILFKKKKSFSEIFLIIILLELTPLLMDKYYARAFVIPLFSIFIGFGLIKVFDILYRFRYKSLSFLIVVIILITSIIFSNVFINPGYFIKQRKSIDYYEQEKNAALFLKSIPNDGSIISNSVPIEPRITALSKRHTINFLEPLKTKAGNVKTLPFSNIIDRVLSGDKVKSFGTLNDWLFGRTYYAGAHEYTVNRFGYNDEKSKLVIKEYNVRYSVGSRVYYSRNKNFHKSIQEIKNKIYDNYIIDIFDIEGGRIE